MLYRVSLNKQTLAVVCLHVWKALLAALTAASASAAPMSGTEPITLPFEGFTTENKDNWLSLMYTHKEKYGSYDMGGKLGRKRGDGWR